MTTVLLVDVVDADSAILASALRVEGFEVLTVKTEREAAQILSSRPVSLTVVDLLLRSEGGANGLEVARSFRARYPTMRVLLTSSYHLSERQLERADCGVSGFIPKPYDVREVVDFIRAKVSGPPSSRRLWPEEAGSGITARTLSVGVKSSAGGT